jgi:predicted ester cyclase
MSNAEANKAIVTKFLSTLDGQNWEEVFTLVSPGCRSHVSGQEMDREGWKGMGLMFYGGFPDGRHVLGELVAEGNTVAVRALFRGTHKGSFQGIPATGKSVAIGSAMFYRIENGQIVEHWGEFDAIGLMQQIGAMPR